MLSFINKKTATRSLLLALAASLLWACSDGSDGNRNNPPVEPPVPEDPNIIRIEPGPDFEIDLKTALIEAQPGNIIILPEGEFDMTGGLILDVDNVIVRGQGEATTILNYAQSTGGDAFLSTSNNVTVEHFALVDPPGDGIKFKGSNGVTIRAMRVEYTCGACEENGAYAIYPVSSKNVLIEDSIAIGASDAGVYVGQSDNIIVRRNTARLNVAGIEIENSTRSDVYDNLATENTGGILAFDLPGLIRPGMGLRIFNNTVRSNNVPNFAPEGAIVATVPQGTGMLIMAFEDVEVFDNVIEDNQSIAAVVVNYAISGLPNDDPLYDPDPRRINVHDNDISNNGYDPKDLAADIAPAFDGLEGGLPDIFYDGIAEAEEPFDDADRICAREADTVFLGRLITPEGGASNDREFFDCAHASLPPVVLDDPGDIEDGEKPPTDEEIAALCTPEEGSTTPNFGALEVNCPTLSGYNLFADSTEPREQANDGVYYDLITPLFTDYAEKYRFIFVPEGKQGGYSSREVMDFPIGTIVAKTFTMPNDFLNPGAGEVIIETRLMLHRADGWATLPYIWREDVSEADLTVAGGKRQVSWIDANGVSRSTNYEIPDVGQCKICHTKTRPETGSGASGLEEAVFLIGPKARFLNMDNEYDGQTINQLRHMEQLGILAGVPEDLDSIDTVPDWEDTAANLEDRAKGYLDINCAHCHRPEGFASNSALFLDYWREVDETYGICKTPVAAGSGSGGFQYSIVPGDASISIMPFRMDSNEPDVRMPEIGRTIIHDEGLALVQEWINSLSGGCD
jgi:parallel beta-helix repeat protein